MAIDDGNDTTDDDESPESPGIAGSVSLGGVDADAQHAGQDGDDNRETDQEGGEATK